MSRKLPGRSSADCTSDYEVGYGRPPRASQFKPGQCGNPKGRPKKARSLAAATERELERTVVVQHEGRAKRMTKGEVVGRQIVDKACRGDLGAARFLRDLIGRPGAASIAVPDAAMDIAQSTLSLDATDRTIITEFVAMIRTGAVVPNAEDGHESRTFDPEQQATKESLTHAPSPTSH